jgi:hypothetical protein
MSRKRHKAEEIVAKLRRVVGYDGVLGTETARMLNQHLS